MAVRQQFFRATQLFLAGATLLLTACGGGGSSDGAARAQVSGGGIVVVPPAFTANNVIDAAYFSNSYEITEAARSSMGYIKNHLTSTGSGGRDLFSINGVSYQLDTGSYSGNGIMINGSQLSFTDKWLTSASTYTSIKMRQMVADIFIVILMMTCLKLIIYKRRIFPVSRLVAG